MSPAFPAEVWTLELLWAADPSKMAAASIKSSFPDSKAEKKFEILIRFEGERERLLN